MYVYDFMLQIYAGNANNANILSAFNYDRKKVNVFVRIQKRTKADKNV